MLKIDQLELTAKQPANVHTLYDRYAGMLLGYIFEIVKDRNLAEEYLVNIFIDISQQFNNIDWDGNSCWRQLQKFAHDRLSTFTDAVADCEPASGIVKHSESGYLGHLNDEQRKVFCDVYYNRKKIAEISIELNKTEDSIRKTLKEAFAIMRNDSEN